MKTFRLGSVCLRQWIAWAAVAGTTAVSAAETTPAPASGEEARSYVVFAGLDVFVDLRGSRRPVVGGSETEVLVWDDQRNAAISVQDVALSASVEPRLARGSVAVDALHGYPVYSPAKDPKSAAHAQQFFLQNLEGARLEESEMAMREAQAVADLANIRADPNNPQQMEVAAQAQTAAEQAIADATSAMGSTIYRDSEVGSMRRNEEFDGFAVAFSVSSPRPVSDAYGVLRLRYRESVRSGALVGHAIKLFRVRKLDAKPRKIVVRQFGLPPGHVIDSYQIHLYADGQELATNTSQNRVEVSEGEAHQFLVLRHLQIHPGATLPAQIAAELRSDVPPAIAVAGGESVVVDLGITAEGKVAEINPGATVASGLTAPIIEELRHVRFLPALANGKAVASRGTFAVGELFLPLKDKGDVR